MSGEKTALQIVDEIAYGPWISHEGYEETMLLVSHNEVAKLKELAAELDKARESLGNNQSQVLFSKS